MNRSSLLRFLALALLLPTTPAPAQQTPEKKPSLTLKVSADYLALHVSGSAPQGASALEYRLTLASDAAEPDWVAFPQPLTPEGKFQFDVALPEWRWSSLEVRATFNDQPLTAKTRPSTRAFVMLTEERLATLPEPARAAWQQYLRTSKSLEEKERDLLAEECRQLARPMAQPAPNSSKEFEMDSSVPSDWYGSAEAETLADAVLSYQTPSGGWSKSVDFAQGTRPTGTGWTNNADNPWHYCGTLDNRSTTEQIKFLARVFTATGRNDARTGALRGLEWLLAAQYPNGGWPQNFPVEPGYHEAITLNDDAFLHALEVLQAVREGTEPFEFAEATLRERAAQAVERGIANLLACQVRIADQPTVWCAQHDPLSLEPVAARLKEPPSLSGAESANLLKFLMREGPLSPDVIAAVESGLAWLDAHRITGLRKVKNAEGKTDYVSDPASEEVYWARFYDVQTAQPMFAGAQDGIVYATFQEMAKTNKVSYDYFSTKPADVVGKEVARWHKRRAKEQP